MEIIVSGINDAIVKFASSSATHAVSFRDSDFSFPALHGLLPEENWLKFVMRDEYFEPGTHGYGKAEKIVDSILAFEKALPEDARVMVNCRAGISRSTATALILLVSRFGLEEGSERFWKAVGMSAPNETLIRIADAKLGLEGKLFEFIENLVDRLRTERGLIVPVGLLRMANKTAADFVFQSEVDDLVKEYGIDNSE